MSAILDVQVGSSADADAPPVYGPASAPKPLSLPEGRLERAVLEYLTRREVRGVVMTLMDLRQMLWSLGLDGVVPDGAVFHNIQAALTELARKGWLGIHIGGNPKQFWLLPGVERFRHDPPESFQGEVVEVQVSLIERAATLLLTLAEVEGFQPAALNDADRDHIPSPDRRLKALTYLANQENGTCSRASLAEVIGGTPTTVRFTLRWFEAEGLLARVNPHRSPQLVVLLPGGCRALIAILSGQEYEPPSGIELTRRPQRPSLDDERGARIISEFLSDGAWHQIKINDIAIAMEIGYATVSVLLGQMVSAGRIERTGATSARQFRATPAGLAWNEDYRRQTESDQDG